MPAYSASGNRVVLYPGDAQTVWNAEKPASGSASQQVALSNDPTGQAENFSVQVTCAADPGTFEIDVQACDAPDIAANYNTITTLNSATTTITQAGLNASFALSNAFIGVRNDFVRLLMKTASSNNVAITATITR